VREGARNRSFCLVLFCSVYVRIFFNKIRVAVTGEVLSLDIDKIMINIQQSLFKKKKKNTIMINVMS
jgi:hypothetical protein